MPPAPGPAIAAGLRDRRKAPPQHPLLGCHAATEVRAIAAKSPAEPQDYFYDHPAIYLYRANQGRAGAPGEAPCARGGENPLPPRWGMEPRPLPNHFSAKSEMRGPKVRLYI